MRASKPTNTPKKKTTTARTPGPKPAKKVAPDPVPGPGTDVGVDAFVHTPTRARIDDLKPHPQNYHEHPADQLVHIVESIKVHGFYRNVVVAKDNTILAGHGSVKAAKLAGLDEILVVQSGLDPFEPLAMKLLIGDNESAKLAVVDDRKLTDLLKTINDVSPGDLLGTGFDQNMLAALAFNTRTAAEIEKLDDAAEWIGMPSYNRELTSSASIRVLITFETEQARDEFVLKQGFVVHKKVGETVCTQWPPRHRDDIAALRFEGPDADGDEDAS